MNNFFNFSGVEKTSQKFYEFLEHSKAKRLVHHNQRFSGQRNVVSHAQKP